MMQAYQWQAAQWQSLKQRVDNDNLAHAMLFAGAQGIGKKHFAQCFVHYLFCKNKTDEQACGECDACHLLNVDNHPDYKYIAPAEGKQIIAIDQIRELIDYLNLTPHSAIKKVAVINHAETLNLYAANSLLKTLEEPPESALLILLTHNPEKLLPTIRSRCQKLLFPLPEAEQATAWLGLQLPNENNLLGLLALANNAPLKALDYAQHNVLQQRNDLFQTIQQMFDGKENPVSLAASLVKQDFNLMLACMNSWIVDMIRLKVSDQPPKLANPDIKQKLVALAEKAKLEQLLDYQKQLLTIEEWKKSNINAQMIIEDMLIRWSQICHR